MLEQILQRLRTGLVVGEEPNAKPYGFHVNWIKWDSGFRGTDLQIGDRIIGVEGRVFDRGTGDRHEASPFGSAEDQYWQSRSVKDGQRITMSVWRDEITFEIPGFVRAERSYTSAKGRRVIGPGGPELTTDDGFGQVWPIWLESFENGVSGIYTAVSLDSRSELKDALTQKPRIDFLARQYPGLFATETKSDFDRVIQFLEGKKYDLTPGDLAYRSVNEHRVDDAIAEGGEARKAFVAKSGAVLLDSLPPVDPIRGDRKAITGKVVEIPGTEMIAQAGHGWYWAQTAEGSGYLIDSESRALINIYRAVERFKQAVIPDVNDRHEFIGKIVGTPTMVATPKAIYKGILIDVIADTVDGKVFVDLTGSQSDRPFAGEEKMHAPPVVDTSPDQKPDQVMNSFINALKLGDEDLWVGFYATWTCADYGTGSYIYDTTNAPSTDSHRRDFVRARKLITSWIYDLRVLKARKIVTLLESPKVEKTVVEIDHVALFDGEYHSMRRGDLHRLWNLQRVDGGPWRITSRQEI